MNEYDIFVPLFYNNGEPVEGTKFQKLQEWLLDNFEGLTFFPQPNKGFWKMGPVTFHDEVVIYRVLVPDGKKVARLMAQLKEKLKNQFKQEEILIIRRKVKTI